MAESRPARRVLLIGWDAADWQFIEPLIARGLMPTLGALRERGAWGNLATLRPPLSPMLWTSIATGHRPTRHRILGFLEPAPDGNGARLSTSTSRRVKALWNILTQRGLRSNVLGWFATQPAEPINGVMVANNFETPVAPPNESFPIPSQSVHPPDLAEAVADLRVHPAELDAGALLPFVPRADEIDQESDPCLRQLSFLLAQTISIQSIATHLVETTDWDLTAIYFEGIDRAGHFFMPFHPPASPGVSARDAELYGEVMIGFYRFHDMMLERLLALAGEETTVVLISDHGYQHEHRPALEAGPLAWHRAMGVACVAGPGVRAGSRLFGANLLDVAPNVLALLGLPAGRDMEGRFWREIFDFEAPPRIASWEEEEGADGRHPPDLRIDPQEQAAVVEQFVALGYLEAPPADQREAAAQAARLAETYLAFAHLDAREPAKAVAILERLFAESPNDQEMRLHLALTLAANGEGKKAKEHALILAQAEPPVTRAWLLLGRVALAEGDVAEAMRWFSKMETESPNDPEVLLRLGQAHLAAHKYQDAERVLNRALAVRSDLPPVHDALAAAALAQGRARDALRHALRATELAHFFPRAHFHVGQALADLGEYERAETALLLALQQAPTLAAAHDTLKEVRRRLGKR